MATTRINQLTHILSGRTLVESRGGAYASGIVTLISVIVSFGISCILHTFIHGWDVPLAAREVITPIVVPILVALPASRYAFGLMEQLIQSEKDNQQLVAELTSALGDVERLSGLLPICANCKDIRDEAGSWQTIETYVTEHSEANFSHGLCPGCAKAMYPDRFESTPG